MTDCMNIPCLICNKEFKDHNLLEAEDCSERLFIYYKCLEVIAKSKKFETKGENER